MRLHAEMIKIIYNPAVLELIEIINSFNYSVYEESEIINKIEEMDIANNQLIKKILYFEENKEGGRLKKIVKALNVLKIIDDIQVVGKNEYTKDEIENMDLGTKNESEIFISRTHFKINPKYYKKDVPIVLGFKFENVENNNLILKYTNKKISNDYEELINLKNKNEEVYFFDPVIFKLEKIKDSITTNSQMKKYFYKIEFENSLEKSSLGYVNPGNFYIWAFNKKSDKKIIGNPFKVMVLPSSITLKDFEEILNEIININRNLLLTNEKTKMTIGLIEERKLFLKDIKQAIDKISKYLKIINKNPKISLYLQNIKIPLNKIKRFSAKTLLEYKSKPYSNRFTTTINQETYDIYEHRIIKYELEKLKQLIIEIDEVNNENLNNYRDEQNAFAKKTLNKYFFCDSKNEIGNKAKILKELFEIPSNWKRTIKLYDFFVENCKLNNDILILDKMKKKDDDKEIDIKKYNKIDCSDGRLCSEYLLKDELINYKITLKTNDLQMHYILSQIIRYIENNEHKLKENFVENIFRKNYEYPKKFNDVLSFFYELENKYPDLSFEKKASEVLKDEMKKLFCDTKKIINLDLAQEEVNTVIRQKNIWDEKLLELSLLEKDKNKLLKKINELLEIPILKFIKLQKENLNYTQIFVNDYRYNEIFMTLANLDKKYKITIDLNKEEIMHKKLDELYEYWVLIKMTTILIERQKWELCNDQNLKDVIYNILIDKSQNIDYGISLIKRIDNDNIIIKLKILYNKKIVYGINGDWNRPDFRFNITIEETGHNPIERNFYCDTKYRKYDEMAKSFEHDICDVAIRKYTYNYNKTDFKAKASFIIHTDNIKDEYTNKDKYIYWGGNIYPKIIDKLPEEYSKEFRIPCHRYGSFSFKPGYIENFITFMKLIMEYHFRDLEINMMSNPKGDRLYKGICWECGHELSSDDIIYKKTKSGVIKYHMICKNCGHFWVKNHCSSNWHTLIKHVYHNYHELEDGLWYVKCPECSYE